MVVPVLLITVRGVVWSATTAEASKLTPVMVSCPVTVFAAA
jgi:hypothetical protein